jgi:hypothetical protein
MNLMFRGAVAGLAGKAAMSAAMAVAKATGLVPGEAPPRTVGRHAEEALGVRDELPPAASEANGTPKPGPHLRSKHRNRTQEEL